MKKQLEQLKQFLPYLAVGLVLAVLIVVGILYWSSGSHMELKGTIQKVRTLGFEGSGSVAVVDFRVQNPADYAYVVRKVEVFIEDKQGKEIQGAEVSDVDAKRMFEYYGATLGAKYNDSLLMKAKIAPHQTIDRMVAVRFDIPEADVQARRQLKLRITEIDGQVTEIFEKPRK